MKSSVAALCLLACLGTAGAAATSTPVERVVNLLTDLKEKLVNDEKVEQQVYDKYACWCEKTTERKANSITDASNELRMVGQTILKLKGSIATLTSEIEELATEIKQNLADQEEATNIRQKENGEYMATTDEMKQALAAMQGAVTVLVNATSGASLLQQRTQATTAVKRVVDAMPATANLKPEQLSLLSDFMKASGGEKYMPQSMTVQGMLKDMYDTFAADLEKATMDEASANRNFEDFIAVKTTELKEAQKTKADKEAEKAEDELQLADAQAIYDDTMEQKQADVVFFDATKEACEAKHEEWTLRSEARAEEIAGVEKALEILTSDDARQLFADSIKPGKETGASDSYNTGVDIGASFLQLASREASPALKAYGMLKAQASKTHSLRLAALAVRVRTTKVGHFDEVVKAIDDMMLVLKNEGAADIAKRDQCKDEYQKIESTIKNVTWLIAKNEAKIDKLTALIAKREEQLAKTVEEIADVKAQMKAMRKERRSENRAFLKAKEDDQDAITLLVSARDALSSYYKNHSVEMGPIQGSVKGAFVQQPEFEVSEDQAPEATFAGKGKRKGEAKGIVQILTMIIEDLNDEIKNGMKNEEATQLEYEKMMDAAEKLKDELKDKAVALKGAIAQRTSEKGDEEADMKINKDDLSDEETYKAEIKPDCDWIIGAFEKRAKARAAEMEGLIGAKEYLAGAMPSLLEKKAAFNDATLGGLKFLGVRA